MGEQALRAGPAGGSQLMSIAHSMRSAAREIFLHALSEASIEKAFDRKCTTSEACCAYAMTCTTSNPTAGSCP
jgi:hypothetical protein